MVNKTSRKMRSSHSPFRLFGGEDPLKDQEQCDKISKFSELKPILPIEDNTISPEQIKKLEEMASLPNAPSESDLSQAICKSQEAFKKDNKYYTDDYWLNKYYQSRPIKLLGFDYIDFSIDTKKRQSDYEKYMREKINPIIIYYKKGRYEYLDIIMFLEKDGTIGDSRQRYIPKFNDKNELLFDLTLFGLGGRKSRKASKKSRKTSGKKNSRRKTYRK